MSGPINPQNWQREIAPVVQRFFRSRIGDAHLAEDLTQQTWIRCGQADIKEGYTPLNWAMNAAVWVLKSHYRNKSRQIPIQQLEAEPPDRTLSVSDDEFKATWQAILNRLPSA